MYLDPDDSNFSQSVAQNHVLHCICVIIRFTQDAHVTAYHDVAIKKANWKWAKKKFLKSPECNSDFYYRDGSTDL